MTLIRQIIALALLGWGAVPLEPYAAEPHQNAAAGQVRPSTSSVPACTSTPCGNTATGEDPQDVALREARRMRDAGAQTSDDRARWKRTLYADATRPQDLQLLLVQAAEFSMQLAPASGQIRFRQPGVNDAFSIEQPRGQSGALCPEYAIDVVTAAKPYALVRKSCMLHEYKPNRFSMGATYYLYDVESHSMRTIWQSQTNGQDDPFPDPSAEPTLTVLADGVQIDWKATYPAEGKSRTLKLNARYLRRAVGEKRELICIDLSAPARENVEVGSCEGGVLQRVGSLTR